MTLEELLARESIRHTLASYTMAGDRLRIEEFVASFVEDGVLEAIGLTPAQSSRCDGRDAIRHWMTDFENRPKRPNIEVPKFLRHHLATSLIELTNPDTAKVRTYFSVYTQVGLDHGGHYADDFRRSGDRWLIAHRRVRVNWRASNSLFRTDTDPAN
jgi:hypothetical protein